MNIKEYMSRCFWRENHQMLVMIKKGDHSTLYVTVGTVGFLQSRTNNTAWQKAQVGKAITLSAIKRQLHVQMRMYVTSCHKRNTLHFLPQSLLEASWNKQP